MSISKFWILYWLLSKDNVDSRVSDLKKDFMLSKFKISE